VVERAEGADACFEHGVDEAPVVVDAFLVRRACARWLNARPRDGEAIAFLVEALEDRDVLRVEMVLVTGVVAGCSAFYFAYGVRKAVPDGFTFAVLIPRAFHLIGSRGHAPEESVGEVRAAGRRGTFSQCLPCKPRSAGCGQRASHELATVHAYPSADAKLAPHHSCGETFQQVEQILIFAQNRCSFR